MSLRSAGLIAVFLLGWFVFSCAATYYVDVLNGNDAYAGANWRPQNSAYRGVESARMETRCSWRRVYA